MLSFLAYVILMLRIGYICINTSKKYKTMKTGIALIGIVLMSLGNLIAQENIKKTGDIYTVEGKPYTGEYKEQFENNKTKAFSLKEINYLF